MKKVLLTLGIIILSGCSIMDSDVVNNEPQVITKFEKAYYQGIKSCMYEKGELISCDYIPNRIFMTTDEEIIRFIKPHDSENLEMDGFGYNIDGNIIYLNKKNSNGINKVEYKFEKDIVNNNIIIIQNIEEEDALPLTIIQTYEKIAKEEYIKKAGAINEK